MRLPRTSLLQRLSAVDAPGAIVLEAPTGFGKSWLLRKAAPPGSIRLRGELGPIATDEEITAPIVIDDAHLLSDRDVERLVEFVEDAPPETRLIVSGRILAHAIHDVVNLVDGLLLDASALAITAEEIRAEVPEQSAMAAANIVEAADGCVKVIAAAIDQARRDPSLDPVAVATRIVTAASAAAMQHLDPEDAGLVSVLARAPGMDTTLLLAQGGPGFVDRVLAAGVPLRRQVAGGLDLVSPSAFRLAAVDTAVADRVATALIERGRPVDAMNLLLDAGTHARAAELLSRLPESIVRTIEPRVLLGILARLGSLTEREPGLLLLRSEASTVIGRVDSAGRDIELAHKVARSSEPPVRRRVAVEWAEWLHGQGRFDEAFDAAQQAIAELDPGEDRTFARANIVLANVTASSDNRDDLQRAAEWYRTAAAAWAGCGEHAKARLARATLATAVLSPLGRFDEALAQFAAILNVGDLTDAERSWMLLNEGTVLCSANRLDSAQARFRRVGDLGYIQDNPRLIACAAWGHALVTARRNDLPATMRWVSSAENTALGQGDDILGVPFHCDMATELGALGELEQAERHIELARERSAVFPDQVRFAEFILAARRGELGDVEAQLAATIPIDAWRVLLVAAAAHAKSGDVEQALALLGRAERELISLGFSDFRSLGEGRTHDALVAAISRAPTTAADVTEHRAAAVELAQAGTPAPAAVLGRRLRVIGGPIVVEEGGAMNQVPAGNPQRLVGVVVAHGGMASFDQLSDAIWAGDDVEASRARLRNVLLRLRRGAGNIVVRAGSGVRLAPDVACDLFDFERLATDALTSARTDPDLAGHLAARAVKLAEGPVLGDFEYEDWAVMARRSVEQKLIGLLDLLSVQAEDAGDLVLAQSLAERALRLDRYSDSRYVRLAELLTMQGRSAAALAVLEDAAEATREVGGRVPSEVKTRRDALMRDASAS